MSIPPPFEPPVALLSSLLASSTSSFEQYQSACTSREKASALRTLAQNALQLSNAATNPFHAVEMFMHQSHAAVCVRISHKMGIFDALPIAGSATVQDISLAVNADPDLLHRLVRAMAAVGILVEVEEQSYAHTSMSKIWTFPGAKEGFHYWEDTDFTLSKMPSYFEVHGYRSPADPQNAPAVFARGERDMDVFTMMCRYPPMLNAFNTTMTISSMISTNELCQLFQFDSLIPGENNVVLVDIGGGKGWSLNEIVKAFPNMKGHVVLEELGFMLESDLVGLEDQVRFQPYNFLNEVQPIKGKTINSQSAARRD